MQREMSYTQRFLNLKCSGDILNIVSPINRAEKEISESWAILRKIKPLTLKEKNKYSIIDLCAGNALTSVMSAFILPSRKNIAMDIRERNRDWKSINGFTYIVGDIYDNRDYEMLDMSWTENMVIISSHPCKHALRIVELFNASRAKALCIIPCCGDQYKMPMQGFLEDKMSGYDMWTYYLASLIKNAKVTIQTDYKILSPKNNVIYAER